MYSALISCRNAAHTAKPHALHSLRPDLYFAPVTDRYSGPSPRLAVATPTVWVGMSFARYLVSGERSVFTLTAQKSLFFGASYVTNSIFDRVSPKPVMRCRRPQLFFMAFAGALLISPSPVHSQSACFSGTPPVRKVVYEQPVSVNTDVLLNTTFYPISDAAITVTNAPSSINGITTLRWTSTFPNQDYIMVSTRASSVGEVSPTPTHSDEVFVLIATDHQRNQKRQSGSYFVSSNGTITNDCTTSPIYTARNGVLTATLDGVVYTYSTSEGVGAAMFVPSTVPGSITTTFTIGSNALLQWQNEAFYNGQASFCSMKNGTVFAVFMQDAQPEGCLFISLSLFSVSSCQAISFATITGPQDKSTERD